MGDVYKIDNITVTKKGRYALFCGGEFLFSLDEETYLKHHIKVGSEFPGEELESLRAASDYFAAKNKALLLLGYRDHSKKELIDKLKRKFDEKTSELAVEKMCELSLVDDAEFAKKLCREMIEQKGASKRAAEQKLYEKGVARDIIETTLSLYKDDECDAIRMIVEKKYLLKLRDREKRALVFAALARKGFKASDIKTVLCEYSENDGEEFNG